MTRLILHGVIGEDVRSGDFFDQFEDASADGRPVSLSINSPGGCVFEGAAIANAIEASSVPTVAHVEGVAASAGSLIAVAANRVVIAKSAMMMIHNPWALTAGDAQAHTAMASVLDRLAVAMARRYAKRMKITRAQVLEIMAHEVWYSADEAIAAGLADELAGARRAYLRGHLAAHRGSLMAADLKTLRG